MGNAANGFSGWTTADQAARNVDLSNKNVIVTGANTGIGLETARVLTEHGAVVYMACRSKERCEAAAKQIRNSLINKQHAENVKCMNLDLSSLQSVRDFAQEFNNLNIPLHILINNAGVMAPTVYAKTKDNFEIQFGTNHLGHFLLTHLLVDRLIEGAPSRVVNVSSMAHKQVSSINFDDLNWEKDYNPWKSYGASKLQNILFANEFDKRYSSKGIRANSLHPGVIPTELGRNNAAADFFYKIGGIFMKSIAQGAATTVYVSTAPELESVGGKYFSDCNIAVPTAAAQDHKAAEKLWDVSTKLLNL
jgi:WW domain-containing oxidoreductase